MQAIEVGTSDVATSGDRSGSRRTVEPPLPPTPGYDIYAAMAPHGEASADFLEVVPLEDRLVVAIGDALGHGLKSAFVAGLLRNAVRHQVSQAGPLRLDAVLDSIGQLIAGNDFFGPVGMQIAVLVPGLARAAIATAGLPYPVRFAGRGSRCDRLPLRGDLLRARLEGEGDPRYDQRWIELEPGDALILLSDGLADGRDPDGVAYGYRFTEIVRQKAGNRARDIGTAILDDWHNHTRGGDEIDDVTLVVIVMRPGEHGATAPGERRVPNGQ